MSETSPEASQTRGRALASDECVGDCRLEAVLDPAGLPVAYHGASGEPPCAACLQALADSRGPARIATPKRPRRGRSPTAEATWEEGLAWAAEALREGAVAGKRLVWISLSRRPRLLDALPRRVTGLAGAGAVWVRWRPAAECVARAGERLAPVGERIGDATDERSVGSRAALSDLETSDLLVLWGADPEKGARPVRQAVDRARGRGVPLVVVDPRATGSARVASEHLPLRPGTDVALAASLVHGMAPGEGPEWTRPWPPARAALLCGCEEAALARTARLLSDARRPLVLAGGGLAWHGDPGHTVAALDRLVAGARGKLLLPDSAPDPAAALEAPIAAPSPREVLAVDDPLGDGSGAEGAVVVLDGAVDLETRPAGHSLAEWLSGADRILALADRWGSAARAADLVLPVPAPCERIGVVGLRHPAESWASDRPAPRPRDLPDPWQMWRAIARRLDWPDTWFERFETDGSGPGAGCVAEAAVSRPADAGGLGAYASAATLTPVHEEAGEGPRATPVLAETYPLQAVVGELPEWLEGGSEGGSRPVGTIALLGPEDAERRGLGDGDPVVVFNGRGSLGGCLRVAEEMARGVVGLPPAAAGLLAGRSGGALSAGGLVEVAFGDS